MKHLYGEFSKRQIIKTKNKLRRSIYFLLLCVDPNTASDYVNVDVNKAFDCLLYKLDGFNTLLFFPQEIVEVMCLLKAAQNQYNSQCFQYEVYRKLVLDAGAEILKIKEVD